MKRTLFIIGGLAVAAVVGYMLWKKQKNNDSEPKASACGCGS
jgi:LPXTG-motif cell wall-anchored protein